MEIELARAARLLKHDRMRNVLTWLKVHMFKSKQVLADVLGVARADISGYMHGAGQKFHVRMRQPAHKSIGPNFPRLRCTEGGIRASQVRVRVVDT